MDNCSEIQRGKERLEVITVLTGFLISLRTIFRSRACIGIVYSWEKVGTFRFLDMTDNRAIQRWVHIEQYLHCTHYITRIRLHYFSLLRALPNEIRID